MTENEQATFPGTSDFMNRTERIRLSQSSLTAWFEKKCPARWHYSRDWRPKEKDEFMERGGLIHSMLAGEVKVEKVKDTTAVSFHNKIKDLLAVMNYEMIDPPELEQTFEILPGVDWIRIIDRVARNLDNKELVLLDYKAGGGAWKRLPGTEIVPQSLGFQSVSYLIQPPPELPQESWPTKPEWPRKMFYLVAGFRGPAEAIPYYAIQEDEANFLNTLQMAVEQISAAKNANWPKAYGRVCLECEFAAMCFNRPGWRKLYEPKHDNDHRKPKSKRTKRAT